MVGTSVRRLWLRHSEHDRGPLEAPRAPRVKDLTPTVGYLSLGKSSIRVVGEVHD